MSKFNPIFRATIENEKLKLLDKEKFQLWIDSFNEGQELEVSVGKARNNRTEVQNNALHLYCEQVAEALNDAGLTIEKVIKSFTMEHEWTKSLVKELLWREAQRFAVKKESTIELDKLGEINKVWEVMNRFLAKLKIESIPFPDKDEEARQVGKVIENN